MSRRCFRARGRRQRVRPARRSHRARASRPAGARSQSARSTAPTEGSRGRLRVRERGDPPRLAKQRRRRPFARHEDAEQRLVENLRSLGGSDDSLRHVGGRRNDRWHEEHDHRVDAWITKHVRQHGLERLLGGRAEHVDGIREARFAGHELGQHPAGLLGELRKLETGRFARVGGEDAEPAGVREQGYAATARQRLSGQQSRNVDELLERICANDSSLVEERVDGCLGARKRSRVRLRCTGTRARTTAFEGEDRLSPRDTPGEAPELPGIAERLEVEQHDRRVRVVLPVLEQVVRGHVGLVADGDERGDADATCVRRLQQCQTERSALRRKSHVAGRERPWRERRVQARSRDRDPETVGTDEARTVRACRRQELILPCRTFWARSRRSRRR